MKQKLRYLSHSTLGCFSSSKLYCCVLNKHIWYEASVRSVKAYLTLARRPLPTKVEEAGVNMQATQNRVFVLSCVKVPLMPCTPARARGLLKTGHAAVYRRYPFTIILKERVVGIVQQTTLKIDPGSKVTGLAVVTSAKVIWAAELTHRGLAVKANLYYRRIFRRSRRNRKTRYRKARFLNRVKFSGWLPPSLSSRVANTTYWVSKLSKYCLLTNIALELVRFDMQAISNPEISGVEYQQGTLLGYEVREYLLEKWGRKCAYCGVIAVPFEVEHIVPRSRGGANSVSNLTIACHNCNVAKGAFTALEFGFPQVQAQASKSLRDAAAVNSIRWKLYNDLLQHGLPIEVGTGGRTKYNRIVAGYPKAHWVDAACVGVSGASVRLNPYLKPLLIKAQGRGNRRMCAPNKYGFPRNRAKGKKEVKGFRTGDLAKAIVTASIKAGTYYGRLAVRSCGYFNIGPVKSISHRHCRLIQRSDGYSYSYN